MKRRRFLSALAAIGLGAATAGCLSDAAVRNSGSVSPSPSRTPTTAPATATGRTDSTTRTTTSLCEPTQTARGTATPFGDLTIENDANESRTVTVEVTNGTASGSSLFDRTVTVEANDRVSMSTGIFTKREGTFKLHTSLDGGSNATKTVDINARGTHGSRITVAVDSGGVEFRRVYVDFTPTPAPTDCRDRR